MSSQVTYLASRSLAVYESSLIEQYGETHRRMVRLQAFKVAGICLGFIILAALVLLVPWLVQNAARYLFN